MFPVISFILQIPGDDLIRLVASDIDGTLLPSGETVLSPSLFPLIRSLREQGILFCSASGRQFHSQRALFASVADELYYLCENGAAVFGPGSENSAPLLSKSVMPRSMALELIQDILALPGCFPLITGVNTGYLCDPDPSFLRLMTENKHYRIRTLRSPEELPEDPVKIAAYCPAGSLTAEKAFRPYWDHRLHVAVSGEEWLDFTLTDKGEGLQALCRRLEITPDQVLAIGDNWNDLSMLSFAGHPRLMASADRGLSLLFPHCCRSVPDLLRELLTDPSPAF